MQTTHQPPVFQQTGQQMISGPAAKGAIFLHKALAAHGHNHVFMFCLWPLPCFNNTGVLATHATHKIWNADYVALFRSCLLTRFRSVMAPLSLGAGEWMRSLYVIGHRIEVYSWNKAFTTLEGETVLSCIRLFCWSITNILMGIYLLLFERTGQGYHTASQVRVWTPEGTAPTARPQLPGPPSLPAHCTLTSVTFWGVVTAWAALPLGGSEASLLTSGLAAMFWWAECAGNPTSRKVGYYCNTLHLGKERMWVA